MIDIMLPITAVVLGCLIPIIGIICHYLTEKSKMRVVEKAVEKGLPLDGLSLEERKGPRLPYRSGMIVMAVGIGTGIFAFLMGQIAVDALYPLLGLAAITALVGLALIINDRINYDRYFKEMSDIR